MKNKIRVKRINYMTLLNTSDKKKSNDDNCMCNLSLGIKFDRTAN